MFTRMVAFSLATAALTFGPALAADKEKPSPDNTLSGSIVSTMDGKVTVLGMDGKRETTFKVGKELEVVCGGKKCGLKDLKHGLPVTVLYKMDADKVLWAVKITSENEQK